MSKEVILTNEGLERLKEQLKELKEKTRPAVIERIRKAKEYGDLSENAEYEDAKNEQSFIEGRIQELQETIKNARVVGKNENKSAVDIGDKVTIKFAEDGQECYEIVGATESDPASGKISTESPIAKALYGHKVGEEVKIPVPDGEMNCKILKVN